MNTPLVSDVSAVADHLKKDVRTLGKEAAKLAHDHIVEPAFALAHDARKTALDGLGSARDAITEKFQNTRESLSDGVAQTQKIAGQQRDRVAAWISARPFAAIGMAVLAGLFLKSIGRRHDI